MHIKATVTFEIPEMLNEVIKGRAEMFGLQQEASSQFHLRIRIDTDEKLNLLITCLNVHEEQRLNDIRLTKSLLKLDINKNNQPGE